MFVLPFKIFAFMVVVILVALDRAAITTGDEVFNNFLTNLTGEEWKRTRMLMSGVFSR